MKYLESMQNVTLNSWKISNAKLNEPVNKRDWSEHSFAVVTNAFYDQNGNNIGEENTT